jgi:hypothetical protein
MVRKRLKPLESICTPTSEEDRILQARWERILTDSGLSMDKGRPPREWIDRGTDRERREDVVEYSGTSNDLVGREEEETRILSGKKSNKGPGPD